MERITEPEQDFGGTMKVCVVVSGGKIASIDIVENSDTPSYLSSASSLISTIISTQSTNVDTVSGATYSSRGIIEAVAECLKSGGSERVFQYKRRKPEQYKQRKQQPE